ncbi:hypothetical protein BO86DRAFT_191555 [Aspergillus japonicus CBS 114.51]|uniref:Zn(2)-C6 fungal-type domain-containing protein n=2 Tax=Aspergillus TaxID=5052 RepID=A0A2V5H0U9_ASPV1|nr:hypothetical protein BO86DRAFT_191555 [Aspergillus japonicus CBS 114.51]PYI17478.1 hypothetical protein BO99DRAFT_193386 [Aspergillus violaceofuscus CBS 115571]RAH85471.1 hypothetical protein BO86DRAFT_191555 [Aspergillus japonicus CBS 114.51]
MEQIIMNGPATRRTHTKSRRGCFQCKQRHVKCDETRPNCSACARRSLSCSYPAPKQYRTPLASFAKEERRNTDPHKRSAMAEATAESPAARLSRLDEMRLFYHFLTITCRTLSRNEEDHAFWSSTVPQAATSYAHVMDALLALAALHMASSDATAEPSKDWLKTALEYHTAALTFLRGNLSSNDTDQPEDADASAICSVCILIFTTAYPNVSTDCQDEDSLNEILEIRMMLKGTRYLSHSNGSLHDQYNSHGNKPKDSLQVINEEEEADQNLRELHREIMERLREVRAEIDRSNHPYTPVLRDTYQLLEEAIGAWPANIGSIRWTLEISDEYLDLLREGDWLARVLLLLHGLGMHLSSRRWCTRNSGKRLVRSILTAVRAVPAQWVNLITWVERCLDI